MTLDGIPAGLKVDFDERDDKVPYELEHKYVMFKLRYDFISEDY